MENPLLVYSVNLRVRFYYGWGNVAVNILIIGATRGIGLRLLEMTIEKSLSVTVLVRDPEKIRISNKDLKVVKGDILDRMSVDVAMEGQDAVCCNLGIRPTRKNRYPFFQRE